MAIVCKVTCEELGQSCHLGGIHNITGQYQAVVTWLHASASQYGKDRDTFLWKTLTLAICGSKIPKSIVIKLCILKNFTDVSESGKNDGNRLISGPPTHT
jgi:hypothetical protein